MTAHVDVMDIVSRLKAAEQAFGAGDRRAHGFGDGREGRRQGGDPSGRNDRGRLDRRRLRQGAVLKAAREALADGEARLVSIQPENLLAELGVKPGESREGVKFAKNMCPSQGTMDIFVEPVLPHPSLIILGASPVAMALAEQARRSYRSSWRRQTLCRAFSSRVLIEASSRAPSRASSSFHAGQGRRGGAQGVARRRGQLSRLRRQPPQDGGAARNARQGGRRSRSALPCESASRPRHRRHHAGGDRALHPRRDHRRAPGRPARSVPQTRSSKGMTSWT